MPPRKTTPAVPPLPWHGHALPDRTPVKEWPEWARQFRRRWPNITKFLRRPTVELPPAWVAYLDETAAEVTRLMGRAKTRRFSFQHLSYSGGQLLITHNGDAPASVLQYISERWAGSATLCQRHADCQRGMPFSESTGPQDVPQCARCQRVPETK